MKSEDKSEWWQESGDKSNKVKSATVKMLQHVISNLDINEMEESGDESEAKYPGCGLVRIWQHG